MIPHYSEGNQQCEHCKDELQINDEAVLYDNCLFCDSVCVVNHVAELNGAKSVYLTDDKLHKGAY